MAAMTYADIPQTRPPAGRRSYPIGASELFEGGLVGVDLNGLLIPFNDVATTTFVGFLLSQEPAAGLVGSETGTPEGSVNEEGSILHGVPVTGATAQSDLYAPVYCATDNWRTDLSLTPTTNTKAIGYIDKLNPDGSFDVKLLTPKEYLILA